MKGIVGAVIVFVGYVVVVKPPVVINGIEALVVLFRAIALYFTFPKYFARDPVGYTPLPFAKVLKNTTSVVKKSKTSWEVVSTYHGEQRTTTVLLMNGFRSDKPSFIYHHGAGSTDPIRDFQIIFGSDYTKRYNVFIVWAQYHRTKSEYLTRSVDSFLHHQQTFAGSVLAYDAIVTDHRRHSRLPIIASGSSMGGIVSSLHAFYFGTADWYFPLVSYPNVGEIFLGDAYRTAVQDWDTKRRIPAYLTSFHMPKASTLLRAKVFPILGEADRIVPFAKAHAFWKTRGFRVTSFPYGHFTPAIMRDTIRHIINETVQSPKR